jgi:hypothetical protein
MALTIVELLHIAEVLLGDFSYFSKTCEFFTMKLIENSLIADTTSDSFSSVCAGLAGEFLIVLILLGLCTTCMQSLLNFKLELCLTW